MTAQEAIAQLRAKGWTDQRIADAVGVTQPTIWRTRSQGANPSPQIVAALAELAKEAA